MRKEIFYCPFIHSPAQDQMIEMKTKRKIEEGNTRNPCDLNQEQICSEKEKALRNENMVP